MISLIVPVYNAQAYLKETIESLCNQTFKDVEIICVDDGSTDNSRSILHALAQKDSRIKLIEQKNQGVSLARNTGISFSTGSILMFIDADDLLTPYACEKVQKIFERECCDVLTFGIEVFPSHAAPLSLKRELIPRDVAYQTFHPDLLFKEYSRPYACRSAVNAELIKSNHIMFEPYLALGEDQVFYFDVYPLARKTVLSSEVLYHYRMNTESATHQATNTTELLKRKLDQHLLVVKAITNHWKKRRFPADFCAVELLEWFLDFLTLDINKLPNPEKRLYFSQLISIIDAYFYPSAEGYAVRKQTKKLLASIKAAIANEHATSFVSQQELVSFYFMRRGLKRCMERVWDKIKKQK